MIFNIMLVLICFSIIGMAMTLAEKIVKYYEKKSDKQLGPWSYASAGTILTIAIMFWPTWYTVNFFINGQS